MKIYEVQYSYSVYDGEHWGYGGEENFTRGYFSTLEKAKEAINSKELMDKIVKNIGRADYDHSIYVCILEHTLDEAEEYGKEVYNYCVNEYPTQEETEYGAHITRIVRVENDQETEIGQGVGLLCNFKEDEA